MNYRLKNLYKNPKMLFGGDYNPEQWLDRPDILKEDIRLMQKAHINVATLGVFSWSSLEPNEGEFHFEWLTSIIDTLYENGIYTVLATPSGARPVWLDEKFPETLRMDEHEVRHKHGWRHNHCITSPIYRKKVEHINTLLAQKFGSHPGLLLWHISNELGGACYCPLCQKKFQSYLQNKFDNNINALNSAWWTTFWSHTYQNFSQIEPPFIHGETSNMGLLLEWRRFTTWNTNDFMNNEIRIFRELTPDVPVTTNFMTLYEGLDYRAMTKQLDIISWDSYPVFHNNYETNYDTAITNAFHHSVFRGMKKNQPFLMMESAPGLVNWHPYNKMQRPKITSLMALQAIGCGSDSAMYFQWRKGRGSFEQYHGAVIGHLGTENTRIYKETCHTGNLLNALSEVRGSTLHPKAAILFDWDTRWAIQDMKALSDETKKYEETCLEQFKTLAKMGIDADIISRKDISSEYSLIIAPMMYMLDDDTSAKIKEYVSNGGCFVSTYLCGYVNTDTLCYLGGFPGDGLTDIFGIVNEEIDTLYPTDSNIASFNDGSSYTIYDYAEYIHAINAEVIAHYQNDYYAKMPVVTKKKLGKGYAWYIAARIDASGMEHIYQECIKSTDIHPVALPPEVEYHCRTTEYHKYHFYLNHSQNEVQISNLLGKPLYDIKKTSKGFILPSFEGIVTKE